MQEMTSFCLIKNKPGYGLKVLGLRCGQCEHLVSCEYALLYYLRVYRNCSSVLTPVNRVGGNGDSQQKIEIRIRSLARRSEPLRLLLW